MIIKYSFIGKNALNEKEKNNLLCLLREIAFANDKKSTNNDWICYAKARFINKMIM